MPSTKLLTLEDAAKRLQLSPRRLRVLCSAGRVRGAVKFGPGQRGVWMVLAWRAREFPIAKASKGPPLRASRAARRGVAGG